MNGLGGRVCLPTVCAVDADKIPRLQGCLNVMNVFKRTLPSERLDWLRVYAPLVEPGHLKKIAVDAPNAINALVRSEKIVKLKGCACIAIKVKNLVKNLLGA